MPHRSPRDWLLALQAGLALSLFGSAAVGAQTSAAHAALVAAIPRVSAATDRAAYATAIQDMLGALGDPVTMRPERRAEPPASQGEPDPRSW